MNESSGTTSVAAAHGLDLAALQHWLCARLPGFEGELALERFNGGQSNPTYLVRTPHQRAVLRCKPGPAARLLPSAHAIEREYRVMAALDLHGVPVPRMLALCTDEAVIGRAFFVMSMVEGRVLWDPALPGLSRQDRSAHYDEMNRVIAALHGVDVSAAGLADFGRPGNYFERQIGRWSRQYRASITKPIDAMDRLMDWLPAHIPPTAASHANGVVVHGDYRLDNLVFHPTEPRILAVLDWELSTLGHPLADFSYHCMTWHIPPGVFRGLASQPLAELGIPAEADYVRRYCERSGIVDADALTAEWPYYLAYNLFRVAAILQGIAKRVEDGTASSARARESAAAARPLAELGWQFALRHG